MVSNWFKHDLNARNDPKVTRLRIRYGLEGYGAFFAILEIMAAEADHKLDYTKDQIEALMFDLRTTFEMADFLKCCITVGLLETDGERIWSPSLIERLKAADEQFNKYSSRGSKAAAARWGKRKAETEEPQAPEQPKVDTAWNDFVKSYEANIGLFPRGDSKTAQVLVSYFDQIEPDAMKYAVELTGLAQAQNPGKYLLAILKNWADRDVTTLQQAKAISVERQRSSRNEPEYKDVIGGDFW